MGVSRFVAAPLHAAAICYMAWGFNSLDRIIHKVALPMDRGGQYQFLTNQSLHVAELTLMFCVLTDLIPARPLLTNIRRALIMIATPLAAVVASIYWSLIFLAPELIAMKAAVEPGAAAPASTEAAGGPVLVMIPLEVDLALHLSPVVVLSIHFFLLERKYSQYVATYGAPAMAFLFALWYAPFVEWCAAGNGGFPYPFLEVALQYRLMIYGAVTGLAVLFFRLLNWLHPSGALIPDVYGSEVYGSQVDPSQSIGKKYL